MLTLSVYVALIRAKTRAMKAGEVDLKRRALYDDAWLFVLSRIVHAWVHTGPNTQPRAAGRALLNRHSVPDRKFVVTAAQQLRTCDQAPSALPQQLPEPARRQDLDRDFGSDT